MCQRGGGYACVLRVCGCEGVSKVWMHVKGV